ncbi:MAG: hypothetical protein GU354_05430 [Caldimicrobium sp.]|nr:hypothetical protein [Caldimicrobium sp.]
MEGEPKKENISQGEDLERIEGIIEDLEKVKQADEELPKTKKLLENKKKLLFFAGLAILLLLIFLGVYLIYQLLYTPKKVEISREPASEKRVEQNVSETKEESTEKGPEKLAKETINQTGATQGNFTSAQRYAIELKNLLFSYGKGGFLRVDVYFFYNDYENFKRAKASELILREAVYEFFINKKDLGQEKLKNPQLLEEELKQYLKKKNLKAIPQSLEIEGVILRS